MRWRGFGHGEGGRWVLAELEWTRCWGAHGSREERSGLVAVEEVGCSVYA